MIKQNPKQRQTIEIELPEEIAEGIYANFIVISHSNAEFIFDFIRVTPQARKTTVKTRVIMAPQNVKSLFHALQQNIQQYEKSHGEIPSQEGQESPFGLAVKIPDDLLPN